MRKSDKTGELSPLDAITLRLREARAAKQRAERMGMQFPEGLPSLLGRPDRVSDVQAANDALARDPHAKRMLRGLLAISGVSEAWMVRRTNGPRLMVRAALEVKLSFLAGIVDIEGWGRGWSCVRLDYVHPTDEDDMLTVDAHRAGAKRAYFTSGVGMNVVCERAAMLEIARALDSWRGAVAFTLSDMQRRGVFVSQ